MKEIPTDDGAEDGAPIGESLETIRLEAWGTASNAGNASAYMDAVNAASSTGKRDKEVEILRFEPSFKFTSDTLRKRTIQKVLFPYYRPQYGSPCNWSFTNYNTLNFFHGLSSTN